MTKETDMECTWGDELRPAKRPARVPRALPPLVAAACVATGILLAVVGESGGDRPPAGPVAPAGHAAVAGYAPDRAAAHRRQVFDERRARFDAQRGGTATDVAAGR